MEIKILLLFIGIKIRCSRLVLVFLECVEKRVVRFLPNQFTLFTMGRIHSIIYTVGHRAYQKDNYSITVGRYETCCACRPF